MKNYDKFKTENKGIGKIKEYRTYRFTSLKKTIKEISDNSVQEERIHIFLTLLWQMNNFHSSQLRKELKQDLFENDEIDTEISTTVHMPNEQIRRLLTKGNSEAILNRLVSSNIIKITYTKGQFGNDARVINLLPSLMGSKKKVNKEFSARVKSDINKYYKVYRELLKDFLPIYQYNYKNKFSITEKTFKQALSERYDRKPKASSKDEYIENHMYLFEKMKALNSNINLANSVFFYKTDNFSQRVHSIFTSLPKELRNFIEIFDRRTGKYTNKLGELDIKNSQALFFAKCVQNEYGYSKFADLASKGEDIYEDVLREYKGEKIRQFRKPSIELTDRDEAKKFTFNMMFMDGFNENDKSLKKKMFDFSVKYQNEGRYIIEIQKGLKKDSRRNIIARQMQKLETQACYTIWNRLVEAKINFVTVHDSILVPEDCLAEARLIMESVLSEALKGVTYKLHENKLNKKKIYNSISRKNK